MEDEDVLTFDSERFCQRTRVIRAAIVDDDELPPKHLLETVEVRAQDRQVAG
jgi:hypothetical protein